MNRNHYYLWTALIAASLLWPAVATAEPDTATNRLTFSSRYGLNISAKFSSTIQMPSRTTPNGAPYNYNNGYVYPDVSGSADGNTWYWGYDNSSSQVDAGANNILLSRTVGAANLRTPELQDDPSLGAEIAYSHELGGDKRFRYGYEAAINYSSIRLNNHSSYAVHAQGTTDAYPYAPGATPPSATPDNPYQGSFGGPGFVIGTTPVSSTTSDTVVADVSGDEKFDADLWGGRLGLYTEYWLTDWLSLGLSAGIAAGWIDASASWNDTIAFTGGNTVRADSGSGGYTQWLGGYYAGANLYWRLTDHWSAAGGAQFQDLGAYEHTLGTRKVELNLRESVFISFGLSCNF